MKFTKACLAGLWILCSCGAQPKDQSINVKTASSEEIVLQAYKLIDLDRTQEAVHLLEESIKSKSQDYELRTTLASAYAHMAGINIQRLYPMINKVMVASKRSEIIKTPPKILYKEFPLESNLIALAKLTNSVSFLSAVFVAMPQIHVSKRTLLYEALDHFAAVEKSLKRGDLIYRTALRLLIIRGELSDGVKESLEINAQNKCELKIEKFKSSIVSAQKLAAKSMLDMAAIDKKKAQSWLRRIESSTKFVERLTFVSDTAIILDEGLNIFVKQQLFGPMFGKLLECPTPSNRK